MWYVYPTICQARNQNLISLSRPSAPNFSCISENPMLWVPFVVDWRRYRRQLTGPTLPPIQYWNHRPTSHPISLFPHRLAHLHVGEFSSVFLNLFLFLLSLMQADWKSVRVSYWVLVGAFIVICEHSTGNFMRPYCFRSLSSIYYSLGFFDSECVLCYL